MPRQALSPTALDHVRTKILSEAATIVGRVGLGGLSMRVLGSAVGLTPGALYRYFPGKQELLLAMWEHALGELQSAFSTCGSADDPIDALRGMMQAYASFAQADPDRFRALFLENDQGGLDVLAHDPNALAPYDTLRAAMAAAMEQGLIRPGDPARACHILWSGIHGALTLAFTVKEIDFGDVSELVNETVETLLLGLRPREASDAR